MNSLSFFSSRSALISPLPMKDSFVKYRVDYFFFQHFENIKLFWPPKFLQQNLMMLLRYLAYSESFIFPSAFGFLKFDYNVTSLSSYPLEYVEIFGCLYLCHLLNLESFQQLFPPRLFLPLSLFLRNLHNKYVGPLDIFPEVPLSKSIFFCPQTQ